MWRVFELNQIASDTDKESKAWQVSAYCMGETAGDILTSQNKYKTSDEQIWWQNVIFECVKFNQMAGELAE